MQPPVRYSPDVETVKDGEAETIAKLQKDFDVILERTAKDYGKAVRSVHAKSHGVLIGTMEIDADLPPELAQGLFATPGIHPVAIRLSTNAGDILPDAISLPRGLAMKVMDVEGPRLPDAEGTTQDFILVNAPIFQAKSADAFEGNLKALAATTDRMETGKKVISAALRGVRQAFEVVGADAPAAVKTLGGAPHSEPLGDTYYSTTPYRYGDHIAKFSMRPKAAAMKALAGEEIEIAGRENAIREDVQGEMRDIDAEWEFCVQLCRDLDAQPIEDPTVEWDEQQFPFQRVAVVRAPRQDSWADAQVTEVNERMRFSIWTGLAAHQPLGNINRARKDPYRHSADFRARTNGCPYHEPAGSELREPA